MLLGRNTGFRRIVVGEHRDDEDIHDLIPPVPQSERKRIERQYEPGQLQGAGSSGQDGTEGSRAVDVTRMDFSRPSLGV